MIHTRLKGNKEGMWKVMKMLLNKVKANQDQVKVQSKRTDSRAKDKVDMLLGMAVKQNLVVSRSGRAWLSNKGAF
jgi:hypothetical protein